MGCSGKDCAVVAKCWAKYQAKRRLHKCQDCYDFKPHTHFERLKQPLEVKSSQRIGVCFSADFWDSHFNSFDRASVMHYATLAHQHWFINLTKQPQNMPEIGLFPANWVQGVSVCTKKDLWKIDTLRNSPAKTKVISFEPLYEHLGIVDLTNIDWIIIGSQTHPLIEPDPLWVDSLIINAEQHGIPIFVKNNIQKFSYKQYPTKMVQ